MSVLLELLLKSAACAAIWVGLWALFGERGDTLVMLGVVTFGAYGTGFWHGRCP